MQLGAEPGRHQRLEPRGQPGGDDTGEHIARSGGGQPLVAGHRQQHPAVGMGDHGGRTLQQQHLAQPGGRPPAILDPVRARGSAGQDLELAVVRGQNVSDHAVDGARQFFKIRAGPLVGRVVGVGGRSS